MRQCVKPFNIGMPLQDGDDDQPAGHLKAYTGAAQATETQQVLHIALLL